jgi:MFS family permease
MMNIDIGGEMTKLLDAFVTFIPHLLTAIILFIIGWIIAAILGTITSSALVRTGLNRKVYESPADSFVRRLTYDPARSIGNFVYWVIMIITITIAISALNIPVITGLVNGIYGYVPNLLGAILILALAIGFSALVSSLVLRWMGDTPTGKVVSTVFPVIIMTIAGFAILEQLKLAPIVITSTYIAVVGALALGFAIAFGLGGADTARGILANAYGKGSQAVSQAKHDIEKGRQRAEEDAKRTSRRNDRR